MERRARELTRPSSGRPARSRPPTGTPLAGLSTPGPRASCVSRDGGGGFSEAQPARLAREGKAWALAPPSGRGGRGRAEGVAGREPDRRLGPCCGEGRLATSAVVSASRSAPRLASWDRVAVGESQSTVPSSA